MSGWIKILEHTEEAFPRATRFLVNNSKIYEDKVEFFLIEDPSAPGRHTLIVATGHKAGCVRVKLPKEALTEKTVGVSRAWLISNWRHWVINTDPNEVYFKIKYEIEKDSP